MKNDSVFSKSSTDCCEVLLLGS